MTKRAFSRLLILFTFITLLPMASPHSVVQADDPSLNFEKPPTDPGIGGIYSIIQDHYGYLWFGTEYSLVRYDGTETVLYQYLCSDTDSIPGLCTISVYETTDGSIWVGTEGGLGKLDRIDGTFHRYTHDSDNPESISHNIVTALVEDSDGTLWAGTRYGLNSLDSESGNFTRYYNIPDDPTSISSSNISAILEDSEGILWIGTQDGLNRFNRESETFSRYYYIDSNQNSLGINTIYETEDSVLWLGTNNGLFNFDKNSDSLVPAPISLDDSSSYKIVNINAIFEDNNDMTWIGTNNGLMKYDREENVLKNYSNNENSSPLPISVSAICQSEDGILWFGTSGGLYKLDQKKSVFNNYTNIADAASVLSSDSIVSFCESSDGLLWISASSGLYKFSLETGGLANYTDLFSDASTFVFNPSRIIYEDSGGYIWTTILLDAVSRFDPETGVSSIYYECNGKSLGMINKIFEDSNGNLVLGTEDGLSMFDNNTRQFVDYFTNPELTDSLRGDIIWEIYEDDHGYLWIGTDFGVYAVDRSNEDFSYYSYNPDNLDDTNSLAGDRIKAIAEDSNDNIWIGTSNGLSKFDRDTSQFTNYRVEDGLPSNIICGLLEDNNGYLWISTNNGLSRLNMNTGVFTNYDSSNGLNVNIFNWRSYYKSQDGELFFGGINGLVSFYPDKLLVQNELVPPVLIEGFTTLNAQGSNNQDKSVEDIREITLPYSSNSFEIDFVAIDYTAPENNSYAYKLEGFDEDWRYTDGLRNSATYTNIPSGEYVFRVKAANSGGVWNEEGASLNITISPPFWQEWWFILLLVATTILSIFIIVRLRTRTLHMRAQELETQVAERTSQLVDKTDQLGKEVRRRVYFTRSLVHELKTPLTPILGASEALASQIGDEKSKGLAKNIYSGACQLNNRIDELLDLAKGEIDMLKLDCKSIDMVHLIEEAARYSSTQALKRGLLLSLDLPDSLPKVSADEARIRQVVTNLIDNAVKFTPEGGEITLKALEKNGDILVEVKDTGPGIARSLQKRLFQPYYRIESDREHLSGLGLGLALCKILVELHGGKIWVKNQKGKGCTFIFSLPLSRGVIKMKDDMEAAIESITD